MYTCKMRLEAIELYKKAFDVEPEGEPWLDDEGKLVHQNLLKGGELFIGISENHHMPDGFILKYSDVCPRACCFVYIFATKMIFADPLKFYLNVTHRQQV